MATVLADDALAPGVPASTVVRRIALSVFGASVAWSCLTVGIPVADDRLFAIALVGLLCASIGRPWQRIRELFVDWVPFAAVVLAYDYSRGWAASAGFGVHIRPQIRIDQALFLGHVPTVWLQDHLYRVTTAGGVAAPTGPVRWWEVVFQLFYVSHFVVWLVVAAVLWARSRRRFLDYRRRIVTLAYAGVATFVILPAAPPWMAAVRGELPATVGRMGRGLDSIGLREVADLITSGARTENQFAALPSLHVAFAVLVVAFLWPAVGRRWRPLLAAYPVAMAVVLVATGEHYVTDVLAGTAYALAVHAGWNRIERRIRSSHERLERTDHRGVPSQRGEGGRQLRGRADDPRAPHRREDRHGTGDAARLPAGR